MTLRTGVLRESGETPDFEDRDIIVSSAEFYCRTYLQGHQTLGEGSTDPHVSGEGMVKTL